MILTSLTQLGRVEKEVEISKEVKIKLHTLSTAEQQKAMSAIPIDGLDEVAKFSHLQLEVLVWATESINGEVVTKDKLREVYKDLQYSVLVQLFNSYLELSEEQGKVLEELKKK